MLEIKISHMQINSGNHKPRNPVNPGSDFFRQPPTKVHRTSGWLFIGLVLQNGIDFRSLSATHQSAGYGWCEALRGDKDAPISEIKTR